ncbi:MAG: SpoIIE family protein phosphatase [Legionella sp.]|nr:SpoIIE family protein phosphatase [Legionella sp.]
MTIEFKQIKYAVIFEALAGETACGDQYLVKEFDDFTLLVVVDGLGHGEDAALAAKKAIKTVDNNANAPLETIFKLCAQALADTRGAAMTIVRIDNACPSVHYKCIGNITGIYWHIGERAKLKKDSFLFENGIVGSCSPMVLPTRHLNLSSGDVIILATDGIKANFTDEPPQWKSPKQIADEIFTNYRNKGDDGLILVAQLL